MRTGQLVRSIVRDFEGIAERTLPPSEKSMHQHAGGRGEEAAYFILREIGGAVGSRNYRTARHREKSTSWTWEAMCSVSLK